ncbi:MAG: hypothetical protein ACRDKI_08030 [Solirubrobacterales bacterium]
MESEISAAASPRRLWGWAIFIAVAGVAARATWYVHFKEDLPLRAGPDGDIYMGQAKAILNGSIGNPDATGLATVYREAFAPGYALFVAGLWLPLPRGDVFRGADYTLLVVFAVQWLLAGFTTLMTFALARRVLFGWSALAPPVIVSLSIALVDMPNMFAYETLLAFLLTATALLLVKAHDDPLPPGPLRYWQEPDPPRRAQWSATLLAGVTLSAALLVQPRLIVLLPFAAWWLWRAAAGRFAALFVVVALVLPGAWMARNYSHFETFAPISINPQASLYMDNVDPVGGTGYVPDAAPPQCSRSVLYEPDLKQHFEWGRCMQSAGFNEITSHPADSALAIPDRFAALFSVWNPAFARGTYSSDKWGYQNLPPASVRDDPTYADALQIAAIVLMVLYVLMTLTGLYVLWLEGPGSVPRMIALPVIVLPLVHVIYHAENRFRLPVLPLIAISITLGVLAVWDALTTSNGDKQ